MSLRVMVYEMQDCMFILSNYYISMYALPGIVESNMLVKNVTIKLERKQTCP